MIMTQKEFQEKLTEFHSQCTITSNGRLYKVPESLKNEFYRVLDERLRDIECNSSCLIIRGGRRPKRRVHIFGTAGLSFTGIFFVRVEDESGLVTTSSTFNIWVDDKTLLSNLMKWKGPGKK